MSEFEVILKMDWLIAYRVVIDCERRRITAYTQDDTRVVFQGDKHDICPQIVDECLKHSYYTRVSLAFSCCFDIIYIVLGVRPLIMCLF